MLADDVVLTTIASPTRTTACTSAAADVAAPTLAATEVAAVPALTISHCDKFDGMLLQVVEAWQRQLDDTNQTQCKLQDQSASELNRDRERAQLCRNIQRLRECQAGDSKARGHM